MDITEELRRVRSYLPHNQQDVVNDAIVEIMQLRQDNNRLECEVAGLKALVESFQEGVDISFRT